MKQSGKESIGEALTRAHPQLGVTAQWLANRTGVNGPNHFSGGILEKGGSGKVFLRPRTVQDFLDVDKVTAALHNSEWNMAERLTADRGRPVYLAYKQILQAGEEMATTPPAPTCSRSRAARRSSSWASPPRTSSSRPG